MTDPEKLNNIEKTLYIPLLARIYVSKCFPSFFYDKKALELENYLTNINIKNLNNEYYHMASVCRQQTIDKIIRNYIADNPIANIVFLGAGLETSYNRINNKTANFYQIDLPDVSEIRNNLLGTYSNEKIISGDMFDLDWIEKINTSLPTLIVVSGVYQYFSKEKVISMIKGMKEKLLNSQLVFDATNSKGLKLANKYVEKTGNKNARMYFSIDNHKEFAKSTNTKLISVTGFYKDALKQCKGLKPITKFLMYFADKLKRTMIIHLSLN